jgi:hypothetical protein
LGHLKAVLAGLAAVGMATALVGCSAEAERPLIQRFFDLCRLRDRTALQQIATVIFEPLQDGIVTTFEIVRVATDERDGAVTKTVTLTAPVKVPGGAIVQKALVVTIERMNERWMITGVLSRSP